MLGGFIHHQKHQIDEGYKNDRTTLSIGVYGHIQYRDQHTVEVRINLKTYTE